MTKNKPSLLNNEWLVANHSSELCCTSQQTSLFTLKFPNLFDLYVFFAIIAFATFVHFGRIGASFDGISLSTDPAMYAAIAAAWARPEAFVADAVFSNPANFMTHVTPLVRLVAWLGEEHGNFGLAYLQLTGLSVFLHYFSFYLLGIFLFSCRWRAVIFTIIMGLVFWTPWGTHWGAGYLDYVPRNLFESFYALCLCLIPFGIKRPLLWPCLMAILGLLVYIHPVSALPAALGVWFSFLASKPEGTSWKRHIGWLVLTGCCFLLAISPYVCVYLGAPRMSLGHDDVAFMQQILRTRFDIEYAEYWYGMKMFFQQYTFLPVLPLAVCGTWVIHSHGDRITRQWCKHIWLWIAGTICVICLFLLDQIISQSLGRQHIEFDLIRVFRFFPFYAICLIFLGLHVLWHKKFSSTLSKKIMRFVCVGVVIGFFLGGQQDMVRSACDWYWNKLDENRFALSYKPVLERREMIDALKEYTQDKESIFFLAEDQSIRHSALRAETFCWKDACLMYYARSLPELRQWATIERALVANPENYIAIGLSTAPDYFLSDKIQDRARLLSEVGPIVWENARYILVRNTHKIP